MKSTLFLLLMVTNIAYAQKETPKLPIDNTTGKITYSEVVYVDSNSVSQDLYSKAREWFAKTYKSSTDVIQMEDKDLGKIIGKALIQVYHKTLGTTYSGGYINYTIAI